MVRTRGVLAITQLRAMDNVGVTGTGEETPDLPYGETDTTLQKKWLFTS
jgi:hypothetical protein